MRRSIEWNPCDSTTSEFQATLHREDTNHTRFNQSARPTTNYLSSKIPVHLFTLATATRSPRFTHHFKLQYNRGLEQGLEIVVGNKR